MIKSDNSFESVMKRLTLEQIDPYLFRFKGKNGEQATMFIKDPNDNILEFKSFKSDTSIFKK